mgnify:CR=1 FL=1
MKTFKFTAILFLLFSGVFGVSAFHHHLLLPADSKLIGYTAATPADLLANTAILGKTIAPLDDNDFLDDSIDDEDDGCFSPKEKISSDGGTCIDAALYPGFHYFSNDVKFKAYRASFFHPHRHFISLRVFRL